MCRAKPTDQLRQETWDMGQLQLRQQTKRFSSLKAASPTVPRQGIWFTVPLNSESNLKSTSHETRAHGKMHSSTNSPAYRGIWIEKTVFGFPCLQSKIDGFPWTRAFNTHSFQTQVPKQKAVQALGPILLFCHAGS